MPEMIVRLQIGRIQIMNAAMTAAATPANRQAGDVTYKAWLAPEGIATDDGRFMDPGSLSWRDGALPLMASDKNLPMHLQALLVANLTELTREPDPQDVAWVTARVLFDSDPDALEFQRMVDCEADEDGCVQMRGVSIDLSVQDATIREDDAIEEEEPTDEEQVTGPTLAEGDVPEDDEGWPEGVWMRVHSGIIVGATQVPMPAFAQARIEPQISIAAAAFPVAPPSRWFRMPDHDGLVPWTVLDEGWAFGHFAPRNSCHTGLRACTNMPEDADFSKFLTGEIVTAEGTRIPVGQVVVAGGHPDDYDDRNRLKKLEALNRAYADPRWAGADITVGIDEWGAWAAGAVRPGITPEALRVMRASPLSGHWRYEEYAGVGPNFLIGLPCVSNQGFPVPRLGIAASAFIRDGALAEVITTGPAPKAEWVRQLEAGVSPTKVMAEMFYPGLAAAGISTLVVNPPQAVELPEDRFEALVAHLGALVATLTMALERAELEYSRYQARPRLQSALTQVQEPSVTVG